MWMFFIFNRASIEEEKDSPETEEIFFRGAAGKRFLRAGENPKASFDFFQQGKIERSIRPSTMIVFDPRK